MKYYGFRNKDSQDHYFEALNRAGHERVRNIQNSVDFFFFDSESVGDKRRIRQEMMERRPAFKWPHTPQACWLWDGVYEPLPARTTFVQTEGIKECMRIYGYEGRIDVVGFGRCEIRDFEPTCGRSLLFVPRRPRKYERDQNCTMNTLSWITRHQWQFGRITMCYPDDTFEDYCKKSSIIFRRADPKATDTPTADMLKVIKQHDIVISRDSVLTFAVALGKVAVSYAGNEPPDTQTGNRPANYEKYRHIHAFPLSLEDYTLEELLALRNEPHPDVERWKVDNIGKPFDADKFIEITEALL